MSRSPIVLVCCDHIQNYRGTAAHVVRDTYIRGLVRLSGATPILLPMIGAAFDPHVLLDMVDGILLTGSNSNIAPSHYGAEQEFDDDLIDNARDMTTLPLLRIAGERDVPVFAICRGFQELNVACGGSLHQFIHDLPGKKDHRHSRDLTMSENFHNHAHKMKTQKGGLFEKWGMPPEFFVNSLHAQGVDRLGDGLMAEGISDDGVIEAVSMPDKSFVVGVQWHPEGDCFINPPSGKVFEEFGKALQAKVSAAENGNVTKIGAK